MVRSILSARGGRLAGSAAVVQVLVLLTAGAAHAGDEGYRQANLVSDLPGVAAHTDSNLVNPWGLVHGPATPFWISDNGTGVSTLYDGTGQPLPLVVTIPPPPGSPAGSKAAPTGVVFNAGTGFQVSKGSASGASLFIFATEDGTISGWNPQVDLASAVLEVDRSASAVYKGLALGHNRRGDFIFAANFRQGTIDVFDAGFQPATLLPGSFRDHRIPAGFAPFDVRNLGGRLFVTYAKQNAEKHDDVAGPHNGFVDVFDTEGRLLRRFASGGPLNSPWGLALAPRGFGEFSHALLVGNFGDGRIHAYDPENGELLGTLRAPDEKPISIDGLWALDFGNGGKAGPRNTLFFTAGIQHEQHGLFGSLRALGEEEDAG